MDYVSILSPIKKYLVSVEQELKNQVSNEINLTEEIIKYLLLKPGKRLRPSIVLLSALSIRNKINKNIIYAATSVELLHNASLIHDDIQDIDIDADGPYVPFVATVDSFDGNVDDVTLHYSLDNVNWDEVTMSNNPVSNNCKEQ